MCLVSIVAISDYGQIQGTDHLRHFFINQKTAGVRSSGSDASEEFRYFLPAQAKVTAREHLVSKFLVASEQSDDLTSSKFFNLNEIL